MAGQKGTVMDKNVLAAVRQLENALDAAIEQCGSTAELNAYFIMEQKVWSACGTCAQDLFWENKATQHSSTKTEAVPESDVQEQLKQMTSFKGFTDRELDLAIKYSSAPAEVRRAMENKREYQRQCGDMIKFLKEELHRKKIIEEVNEELGF
jgi:hypothetical protein